MATKKAGKTGAKGRKSAKKKESAPAQAQPGDNARIAVKDSDIKYLAKFCDEQQNKAGAITGAMGQEISTYVGKGLNGPAFRIALRLFRLGKRDPIKLRAMLDDVERYSDVLGLDKMAAADMFKDNGKASPDGRPRGSRKKSDPEPAQTDLVDAVAEAMEADGGGAGLDEGAAEASAIH